MLFESLDGLDLYIPQDARKTLQRFIQGGYLMAYRLLELRSGKIGHRLARCDNAIMDQYRNAIPANANIGLDAARADHYRRLESSERIFGRCGVVTTIRYKQHNI